ncbi:ATP-binding cassette sub-family G member 4 [Halotydeus destructor]|nr:ATP-binding cassette sub-family G member 4 [Halotydeus destructor]
MVNKLTPIEATAITIKDDKFEKCSLNWSNLVYKVESKKVQLVDNSDQGLAILLTIHQPSSRILELFDHLYMLSSQGNLAYSGQPGQLVSHLASCGIECPKYTNPSELAIELASGQFGDDPLGLSVKLASAKVESAETGPRPTGHRHVRSRVRHLKHFKTLLWRNFIMMLRDPVLTSTQLAAHLFVALIVSLMYGPQVGQVDGCNAKTVFDVPHPLDPASLVRTNENVSLILFSLMFLSFTSMMPTILTIPKEIAVFRKEHTNGWYSVILYYLARLVVDLPFQFAFPTLYCVIVCLMTGQLDDDDRVFLFVAACCAMSLVSQSIGIVIGTSFPDSINLIVFLAPIVTIPGFLFSGFFVRLRSMPPSLKPFSYLSFVKYSFESVLLSVYGFDRCRRYTGTSSLTSGAREAIFVEPEVTQNATVGAFDVHKAYQYRYYHSKPFSYVLNEYAASDTSYWTCLSMLGVFFIILRLCFGMVLMGIGIWLRVDPKMYETSNFIEIDDYIIAAWIMMVTGFILTLMSFVGCYGSVTECPCVLGFYIFILFLCLLADISGLVLAAQNGFGAHLEMYLDQQITLQIQQRQFSDEARKFLDFVQVKLKCCGSKNFNDYHRYGMEIPVSCGGERTNFVNRIGCARVLTDFINLRGGLTVALCAGASLTIIGCLICAMSIYCAVKHRVDVDREKDTEES